MALLQVQVLEAVREEVQVGGGRVEVIIDRDTQAAQVGLQYHGGAQNDLVSKSIQFIILSI